MALNIGIDLPIFEGNGHDFLCSTLDPQLFVLNYLETA